MLKKLLLCMATVLAGASAPAFAATTVLSPPRQLGEATHRQVLYLNQTVSSTNQVVSYAHVGPLATSSSGYGVEKGVIKSDGLVVGSMPSVGLTNPTTLDTALAAGVDWLNSNKGPLFSRLATYLKNNSLSSAYFAFEQEIYITTVSGPMKKSLVWSANVDQLGKAVYGLPKVIDPEPTILEATYTPASVAENLPATWAYPDAGQLKYRVLTKKFEPKTGWTAINTGGAFDSSPVEGNIDARFKCLVDQNTVGCGAQSIDIRRLMDQTGTSFAVVDYVRTVEPVYDDPPANDPDKEMLPKTAISYDTRIYQCDKMTNSGSFGFVLLMMADRYMVEPAKPAYKYTHLQSYGGTAISPTEPFLKEMKYEDMPPGSSKTTTPLQYVINPYPNKTDLWKISDPDTTAKIVYLAPLTMDGSSGDLKNAVTQSDMTISSSMVGNAREYLIGTIGDNYWSEWMNPVDRSITFTLDNPAALEEMAIFQQGFDDHMRLTVNGTTVFVGPYGGNQLSVQSFGSFRWCTGNRCTNTATTVCSGAGDGQYCGEGPDETTYGTYSACQQMYSGGGDSGNDTVYYVCGYDLSNPCSMYYPVYNGARCDRLEQNTEWRQGAYIDLRPYLNKGFNRIDMRVIIGDKGEGWFWLRSKMCGASLGLDMNPKPVPSTGGQPGVHDSLEQQH